MSARQLLETLRKLSKVFGFPINVIISATAIVFYPLKFTCHLLLQEAAKQEFLSSDSASSDRGSINNHPDIVMEVC